MKLVSILLVFAMLTPVVAAAYTLPRATVNSNNNAPLTQITVNEDNATEPPQNFTDVWWDIHHESWNGTFEWKYTEWEFGPVPRFYFYFQNGTPITEENDYIPLNEPIIVSYIIPTNMFEVNRTLGSISLDVSTWINENLSAYASVYYDVINDQVNVYSSVWNATADPNAIPHEFLTVDATNINVTSNAVQFEVNFTITFNDYTPIGMYWFWCGIYDDWGNYIQGSWRETKNSFNFAVGVPAGELELYYNGWYLGLWTMDHQRAYTVAYDEDFIIQVNTTTSDISYVFFSMWLPYGIEQEVNITTWHWEKVTHTGAWEYNETLGTYVWNSSKVITTMEWVYGPTTVKRWISFDTSVVVNYTDYDYYTGEAFNSTMWLQKQVYYVYNASSGNFSVYIGYDYWSYNTTTEEWDHIIVRYPWNGTEPLIFELNTTASNAYTTSKGKLVVNFIGHFTKYAEKGRGYYFDNVHVFTTDGEELWRIYPQGYRWEQDRIYVATLVAFADLYNSKGEKWTRFFFPVKDENEWFIVNTTLQGGYDLVRDVDAIAFILSSWDYRIINENETRYYNLFSIFGYDILKDQYVIETYNQTQRYVYVNGTYWDWALVNKTGWHYEWNESRGDWDWVYGNYTEWDWVQLTGYHWEWQYYNQTSGTWTTEWIPLKSDANKVSYSILESNGNATIVYGTNDVVFSFNLSFTANAPKTFYNWEVILLNYTLGPDYSKPYGEYKVTGWKRSVVFSIQNGTDRLYVPRPMPMRYVEINGVNYPIKEKPYIVINNEQIPIKYKTYYDPYNDQTYYFLLSYGWNETTGESYRYYTLYNDTKVIVHEGRAAYIFNVSVDVIDDLVTYSSHQEWVLTYMNYPMWDPAYNLHFIQLINGDFVYINNYYFFNPKDNSTMFSIVGTTELNETHGYFMIVNGSIWFELADYMYYDYITDAYYVILANGTRIDLTYDDVNYYYYFMEGSTLYVVSQWGDYYTGEFTFGSTTYSLSVPWQYIQNYYYTTWPDGLVHVLPKPDTHAYCWCDLERTITDPHWPGMVPVLNFTIVNGTPYLLIDNHDGTYNVTINGTTYNVVIQNGIYTRVNGIDVWNITRIGTEFAVFTPDDYENPVMYINSSYVPFDPNYAGSIYDLYNSDTGTYDIPLFNGTVLTAEGEFVLKVYYVKVADKDTVITMSPWLNYYEDTMTNMSYYYLTLINGSKMIFNDWVPVEVVDFEYVLLPHKNTTVMEIYSMVGDMISLTGIQLRVNVSTSRPWVNGSGMYITITLDNGSTYNLKLTPLRDWYNDSLPSFTTSDGYTVHYLYNTTFNNSYWVVSDPLYDTYTWWRDNSAIIWNVTVNGTTYVINKTQLLDLYPEIRQIYHVVDMTGDFYFIKRDFYLNTLPIFNLTFPDGSWFITYADKEFIEKSYYIYGYPYSWHFEPMDIVVIRSTEMLIFGTPNFGMWGYHAYTINPENGALDLDGDLSTTEDQFYVKRVYHSKDTWSYQEDSMFVHILWEPNAQRPDDELVINSWMGISRHSWSYEWNETYYWYYANNVSIVSPETMAMINSTLWGSNASDTPAVGYWDIAHMSINVTWQDIVERAKKEGWDWLVTNTVNWTWLWFGFEESYWTNWEDNTTGAIGAARVSLRYEYAGMFIYNDTDDDGLMDISLSGYSINDTEATHYFIPTYVDSVIFTSPGANFGVLNDSGHLVLPMDANITFGIEYVDVHGKTIPFASGRAFWDWWGAPPTGSDFRGFDDRPTDVTIDSLMFLVHFQGNTTPILLADNVTIYSASIKIDQHVGNWDVNITGGRDVLVNRSLSVNWYVFAETEGYWSVTANGTTVDNNEVMASLFYNMTMGDRTFAEIRMNPTYVWGKNTTAPYTAVSQTVPVGTFQAAYSSADRSSDSLTGWAITSTMYFLSVGFPEWDGYYVFNDPETIVYTGSNTQAGGEDTNPPVIESITYEPQEPHPNDQITLRFAAYDAESGLKDVVVTYSYDGNEFTATTNNVGGDFYEAQIGPVDHETTIHVVIKAIDNAGNVNEKTIDITVTQAAPGGISPGPGGPGGLPVDNTMLLIGLVALVAIIVAVVIIKKRRS